ncbi:MAG: cysteine desulfurase [Sneathiella sp.]|nr:cysteine desulfurase [Sneathiella sp.]
MSEFSAANPLFLDSLATTPLAPEAYEAMAPYLQQADLSVRQGQKREVEAAINRAHRQIAGLAGAKADEVIFTSGATEANNMAIYGMKAPPKCVLTTAIEHSAILEPLNHLESRGTQINFIPLDASGRVDLDAFKSQITHKKPDLVTVQATNNEIGVRQPINEIGAICRNFNVIFHIDAAQGVIGQQLDFSESGAHMMSLSSHKIHGPQGVGALLLRRDMTINPLLHGGGQQYNLRPGTLPIALIAGFGAAAELASKQKKHDWEHIKTLKNAFLHNLRLVPNAEIQLRSANDESCHPGLISLSFGDIPAEDIIAEVPELVLATGAACNDARGKPSHVLKALGYSAKQTQATLRIGLGRYVTKADAIEAANILSDGIQRVVKRNVSS